MPEQESRQVSGSAAEIYEKILVPAMLGQWATQLADAARVASGDQVLDVACGTGVVAREAAKRVAAAGQVTGLDLNDDMLRVAQRIQPEINWSQGDATELPFEDVSFDVVVCQFALMFFPDWITALKEMVRVLKLGGRLGVAVWGSFEHAMGYVILTEIAEKWGGHDAADILGRTPFTLGDKVRLANLLTSAGIFEAMIELREGTIIFPTIKQFIEAEVKGSSLDDLFDQESYQGFMTEAEEKLQQFRSDTGEVRMPMDAYIVTADKM